MAKLLRRPIVWFFIVILVAGAAVGFSATRPNLVEVVTLKERRLEQHLVASGRVWVPSRVQISARVPGLVVAVGAVEGQRVKAGDLLVQLDDTEARAAVAQFKASVEQSKARVEQLKRVGAIVATQSLREAETNLEQAEEDLKRQTRLAQAGAATPVELENARRAVERARAQQAAAEAQQLASSPLGADSRLALTSQLQAEAQLAGAEARLAQARVVARQSGVVLTRSVEPGDVVQPGPVLMTLAADSGSQLVIEPDERNLADIRLGQRARAAADAFPQQPFDAEVDYVAPSVDPQRGSVEVRLKVDQPPPFLLPDMTVSVDLTLAVKDQAKVIPREAVRDLGGPSPWVYLVRDGRLARHPVQLGVRGDEAVEVTGGLAAGDEVVASEAGRLTDGQRVRTTQRAER